MEEMKKLYKEIQERIQILEKERENLPCDDLIDDLTLARIDGRIAESTLVAVRIQQILLNNIK